MENLDDIVNEQLDLDEGIFSTAKAVGGKIKKNMKRAGDLNRALGSRVKNVGRNASRSVDDKFINMNAKTDALNNKRSQIKKQLTKYKVAYLQDVKELMNAFINAEGEDGDEKIDDENVQKYLNRLHLKWKEMNKLSDSVPIIGESTLDEASTYIKSYWDDLHQAVLNFKADFNLDKLKKYFNNVAEKVNKGYNKTVVEPVGSEKVSKQDDKKGTEQESKSGKTNIEQWAEIADDIDELKRLATEENMEMAKSLLRFHKLFPASIKESFLGKMTLALVEENDFEITGDDWEDVKQIYRAFYNKKRIGLGAILRKWNENSNNEIINRIAGYYKKLDDDKKKEIDKLVKTEKESDKAKTKETESSETESDKKEKAITANDAPSEEDTVENKSINKKYERVKLALKEMENFDEKDDAERLKKIIKKYPDVDDDTIIGAYGLSDKNAPDSMPINIGGEKFTKKEFLLMLNNLEESVILSEKMAIVPGIIKVKKLLDKGWDKEKLLNNYVKKDSKEVKPLKTSSDVQIAAQKLNKAFAKLKNNPEKVDRLMKKIRRQLPNEIRKRITINHITQIFQMLTGKKQAKDLGESIDLFLYEDYIMSVIKEELKHI